MKQVLMLLGMVWALTLSSAALGQPVVKYHHTDALGSVVVVTDANRNVIERREYEPYGAQLTPAVQGGPGYTGHVQDAATGLVYMQQRYYDPVWGVFLSVDPVTAYDNGDIRHFSRYVYAFDNPYSFNDPDGRCSALINNLVGGLPCNFQQRNLNPDHVAADAAVARDARTLAKWQGHAAAMAIGGGTVVHGIKVAAKSKEAQLAFCVGLALCGAKDLRGVLKKIEDLGDVAAALERRGSRIKRLEERRAPSHQRPPPNTRHGEHDLAAQGGSSAAGAASGRSGGFQGVFRVEGRIDSKRLDESLKR